MLRIERIEMSTDKELLERANNIIDRYAAALESATNTLELAIKIIDTFKKDLERERYGPN